MSESQGDGTLGSWFYHIYNQGQRVKGCVHVSPQLAFCTHTVQDNPGKRTTQIQGKPSWLK